MASQTRRPSAQNWQRVSLVATAPESILVGQHRQHHHPNDSAAPIFRYEVQISSINVTTVVTTRIRHRTLWYCNDCKLLLCHNGKDNDFPSVPQKACTINHQLSFHTFSLLFVLSPPHILLPPSFCCCSLTLSYLYLCC